MSHNLIILFIGLSGIVAQVIILRELSLNFYANELTIGVVLGNWILLEALGVFIGAKSAGRTKRKMDAAVIWQVIFLLSLFICVYLARIFKAILGLPFAQAVGLPVVFYVSLVIMSPLAITHGVLFGLLCNIYPPQSKGPVISIGRVYGWEIAGSIAGGILFAYLFLPYLNSFQVSFIILILNLAIFMFLKNISRLLKAGLILLVILAAIFFFLGGINYLHRVSLNKQWQPQQVLDYRSSVYGNIAVTKEKEQYTFFYNGLPAITAPYPDRQFVQEFGNLPLLFHNDPQDILVLNAGAGGLLSEILKHPIRSLDYAELDPLIIQMVQKHHTPLIDGELKDRRVRIKYTDARRLVRESSDKYDVILMGLSGPRDLATNRFFTEEFFHLVKKRLNKFGVFAFCLPGSLTYISRDLRDLNACILNALKGAFSYTRVIPGYYNMFLVSDDAGIKDMGAALLIRRIGQRQIDAQILTPAYLDYRLDKRWLEWFRQSQDGATIVVNRDLAPYAVFQALILWNKQFSPVLSEALSVFKSLKFSFWALIIILGSAILFLAFPKRRSELSINYAIFTTGFFGMMASLALVFSFQAYCGYLYYKIGFLLSIFMGGIAGASFLVSWLLEKNMDARKLFLGSELAIIIFSALLMIAIPLKAGAAYFIFLVLFFGAGFLVGAEFPLAVHLRSREKGRAGYSAGMLYAADLMGGWLAGILGGVIFLPILGLYGTCLIVLVFKLFSLFCVFIASPPKFLVL